jgi:hypothetical protein
MCSNNYRQKIAGFFSGRKKERFQPAQTPSHSRVGSTDATPIKSSLR